MVNAFKGQKQDYEAACRRFVRVLFFQIMLLAKWKLLKEIKAGIGSKFIHIILFIIVMIILTVEGVRLKKKFLQSERGVLITLLLVITQQLKLKASIK